MVENAGIIDDEEEDPEGDRLCSHQEDRYIFE